jgi:hypothetical protein
MEARSAATLIGAGRVAFGAALILAPRAVGRGWIGEAAGTAGGKVAVRAVGARDVILGLGGLVALRRGGPARGWLEAGAAADIADLAIAIGAFGKLPPLGRIITILLAGGSAVASALFARRIDDDRADVVAAPRRVHVARVD